MSEYGTPPRYSATFDRAAIAEIQRAAATGIYDIRGGGAKRKLPHFDDLLFLGASVSRYPLEGYREKCGTDVVLGTRHAKKPLHLKIPITIAGMNKQGTIVVHGNAGTGVAENMMSGEVRVKGDASQSAGATGRGGLLVIEGNASARCGISMKGIDIVVKGDIGAMSAFMAQAGNLVVLGSAGENLGDSIYEARLFVRGPVKSLGADCIQKDLTPDDREILKSVLSRAGINGEARIEDFRLYGSARTLYHFHVDNAGAY